MRRLISKHAKAPTEGVGAVPSKETTTTSEARGVQATRAGEIDSTAEAYAETHLGLDEAKYEVAAKAVADSPDVRMARVEDIKARIEAGTYEIDTEAVAERLAASGLFDDVGEG